VAGGTLEEDPVSKKSKGSKIDVSCIACGSPQRIRTKKLVRCDFYTCGRDGCKTNPDSPLPDVPDGHIRVIEVGAAGGLYGWASRPLTPEERAASVTVVVRDRHAEQKLRVREDRIVDNLVTCLERCEERPLATREDFLEAVKTFPEDLTVVCGKDSWGRGRMREECLALSDRAWASLVRAWGRAIKERRDEETAGDDLLRRLESAYPDEDFDLVELVRYDAREWGIKIGMCGGTYLLSFSGSLAQLADGLLEEVALKRQDIVSCPFCDRTLPRHHWYDAGHCQCLATIVKETTRSASRGMGSRPQADAMRRVPGAVSVGRCDRGWEMWFVPPGLDHGDDEEGDEDPGRPVMPRQSETAPAR
jgi:hypothetical protein